MTRAALPRPGRSSRGEGTPPPAPALLVGEGELLAEIQRALSIAPQGLRVVSWDDVQADGFASRGPVLLLAPLPARRAQRVLSAVRERTPSPVVVLVSRHWSDASLRELYYAGASAVYEWPHERDAVLGLLALMHDAREERAFASEDAEGGEGGNRGSELPPQSVVAMVQGTPGLVRTGAASPMPPLRLADHRNQGTADALLPDLVRHPRAVRVQSRRGHVWVLGALASRREQQRVQRTLTRLPDVRAVECVARIDPAAAAADHRRAEGMMEELTALGVMQPRIQVLGKIAVVGGGVTDDAEADAIGAILGERLRLARVINELQVRPPPHQLA